MPKKVALLLVLLIVCLAATPQAQLPVFFQAPIRLRVATFTPARGEAPEVPPGLALPGYEEGQRGYFLIQFRGPIQEEWKASAEAAGAELLEYIPDFAFKVRMTPAEARQLTELESLAWIGPYHPAYKLSPEIRREGRRLYMVRIERGASRAAALDAITRTVGAEVVQEDGRVLVVALEGARVEALARVLDVAWVENFEFRKKHNEFGGGVIMGAGTANTNGYDGSTQVLAIADTGLGGGTLATAHRDLPASRIFGIANWSAANSPGCYSVIDDGMVDVDTGHGTHVALSAVGGGAPTGFGRGTAPAGRLFFQAIEQYVDFSGACGAFNPDGYYLIGIPADISNLFAQAYTAQARAHSNSWGSDSAGAYTTDSMNADKYMWTHKDALVLFSAGNAGADANHNGVIDNGSIGSPATAKNVLSVGASENSRAGNYPCDTGLAYTNCAAQGGQNNIFTYGAAFGYTANPIRDDPSAGNAEQMAAFSSRGPTSDGRIKPDVVAPGTWVLSGYSDLYQQGYDAGVNPRNGLFQYDGWGFPRDAFYKYLGGTSMSTPLTAGGAIVVSDFYNKAHGHDASAALVKATLINTAVDLLDENNDGVNDNAFPIPNPHEGWGRVDLAAATSGLQNFVDNTGGLATSGVASFSYGVPGTMPFKVTLVWTDFQSTEAASVNLVNDLDLVVTSPTGDVYRGNVFSGGWSQTGGTADRRNNVENVYVQSAMAGTWTVEVRGFNVPNGPQPFALVVTGAGAPPPPPNDPPTASFTFDCTDLSCNFDASGSSDSDGTIANYAWTFGDGSTGSGVSPSHTYGTAAGYTVTLTVTDDQGATGSSFQQVIVTEPADETPPVVQVLLPNGGEKAYLGSPYTIEWAASDNSGAISFFDVFVSLNSGKTFSPIPECTGVSGAARSCAWTPAATGSSQRIRVEAHDAAGNVGSDSSNANFSVLSGTPAVTVTQPNTTLIWPIGTVQRIKWSHNLGANSYYRIELSRNGGSAWELIAASVKSSFSSSSNFDWTVTGPATTQARVRVIWLNGPASDTSNVNFTIADPFVRVTQPNTALNWMVGSSQLIKWSHNLGTSAFVSIELSRNGGTTWEVLASSFKNTGTSSSTFNWTVTGPATTQARVRVTWIDNPTVTDTSDVNFTISNPSITVTQPNTALKWTAGFVQQIKWSHNLGSSAFVNMELSRDGGTTWETLAASFKNTSTTSGTFNWTVTGPATTQGRVRITWTANAAVSDTSDVNFTIAEPSITVTQPNTALKWTAGFVQQIKWGHNLGSSAFVNIELSRDDGTTWETLATSFKNTGTTLGTFNWTVTGPATTQGRVRVSWTANPAVTDTSDVNFTIAEPSITVTQPNTALTWAAGSAQLIKWSHNLGNTQFVKIELSRDGGTNWELIAASVQNTFSTSGNFNWTVTGPATTQGRVRVSWTANPAVSDISNTNFTIQ